MSYSSIFIYLLILLAINKLLDKINSSINSKKSYFKILSRKTLSTAPYGAFVSWCYILFRLQGCKDTKIININKSLEPNISFTSSSGVGYGWVLQKTLKNSPCNEDDFNCITLEEVENILGYTIRNNISKAFIVTSGNFSKEALEFMALMSHHCNIIPLDGVAITSQFMALKGGIPLEY